MLRLPLRIRHAAPLLEVATGAKGAITGSGEDYGAAGIGVGAEGSEHVEHVEAHLRVHGIHRRGPVDGDLQHVRMRAGSREAFRILTACNCAFVR